MKEITTLEQFDKLTNDKFLLLKHSNTCPISKKAFEQVKLFEIEHDITIFYLIVQNSRDLSNYIAEKFSIKHESPQIIYFKNTKPIWNDSHFMINLNELKKNIQ
jgi:bacillithiol system protein YtxJ